MQSVLWTVHGSHLYGLAHEHSDYDTYRVVLDTPNKHTIRDNHDATEVQLDSFIAQVHKGVPQAVEALFSRRAVVLGKYAPMLQALRPGRYSTYDTYRRTALNFGLSGNGYKSRRHAIRLMLNLQDFMAHSHFNPTLTEQEVFIVNSVAKLEGEVFEGVLRQSLELRGW